MASHDRTEILTRFDTLPPGQSFTVELGRDDTAYDVETGDTLLGPATVTYSWGEFPGTARRALVEPL
jgi:hypothetical protein